MTKNEVMNYVTETPHNVNKNILGQKLDEFQKNVSWNDLKDKPFYAETEVILEQQTLGFVENNGMYGSPLPATLTIPTGEVTIMWDGVEYKCNNTDNIFGNTALMDGKDTGEPFVFGKFDSSWVAVSLVSTATSHEVGIYRETVHKLDAKYLPDGVGGGGFEYDVIIVATVDDVKMVHGSYDAMKTKMEAICPVSALVMYAGIFEGEYEARCELADHIYLTAQGVIHINAGGIGSVEISAGDTVTLKAES